MSSSVCLTNKLHYLNKDSLVWIVEALLRRIYPEKDDGNLVASVNEILLQKSLSEIERATTWAAAPIDTTSPLSVLELDVRTYNCIQRYNCVRQCGKILTVGDLIGFTAKELRNIPGLGNRCLDDIEKQLGKKGLYLMGNGQGAVLVNKE